MVKVLTFVVILQGFDLDLHVGYAGRQLGVDVAVLHALVPAVHLAGGRRIGGGLRGSHTMSRVVASAGRPFVAE